MPEPARVNVTADFRRWLWSQDRTLAVVFDDASGSAWSAGKGISHGLTFESSGVLVEPRGSLDLSVLLDFGVPLVVYGTEQAYKVYARRRARIVSKFDPAAGAAQLTRDAVVKAPAELEFDASQVDWDEPALQKVYVRILGADRCLAAGIGVWTALGGGVQQARP